MLIVGIYLRISKDRSGMGFGVVRQEEDCRAHCERRGFIVFRVYCDNDISSSRYARRKRPEFRRLCEDLKTGVISGVVAYNSKRLIREPRELEDFIELVEVTGATVETVTSGNYDLTTAAGRAQARIFGAFGAMEAEEISERTRREKQQAAQQGRPNGGGRCFGYEPDGLTLVPAEAALIVKAAEDIVSGIATPRSIAIRWNTEGVLTPGGNGWLPQVVRRSLLWPRLQGKREHRGEIVGDAAWPAILGVTLAKRLEAVLKDPARTTANGVTARRHAWAGFLFCERCGAPLRTARVNKQRAWACKRLVRPTSCGCLSVKAEPAEEVLLEALYARVDLARTTLLSLASQDVEDASEGMTDRLRDAERKLADIEDARFVNGSLSHAGYLRAKVALEEERDEITRSLASTRSDLILADLPTDPAALASAWAAGDLEWRRALIGALISRVMVRPAAHRGARFDRSRLRIEWQA